MPNNTISFENPDDHLRFRDVLSNAEFSDTAIFELTGASDLTCSPQDLPGDVLFRTRNGGALGCLVQLLYVGMAVPHEELAQAIAPMTVEHWERAGLVQRVGDRVLSSVMVFPHDDMIVVTDRQQYDHSQEDSFVMGVGAGTNTLSQLTIRRPVSSALDLGTGCGFLALLAAGHSGRVVGVDLNPRALAFARFNTAVNGLSNVSWLEQDMFELGDDVPSGFDLIMSHPPMVISPGSPLMYRDSPLARDGLIHRLGVVVAQRLAEGGFGQFLASWIHRPNDCWPGWLEESMLNNNCDSWIMKLETNDARSYASFWTNQTAGNTAAASAAYQRWTEYFVKEGITAISTGLITMRKRSDSVNWYRADDAPESLAGPAGQHVASAFDATGYLHEIDDAALLCKALAASESLIMEQRFEPSDKGWHVARCISRLTRGLRYEAHHDEALFLLITECDGITPLGVLISRLQARIRAPEPLLQDRILAVIRMFITHGLLLIR